MADIYRFINKSNNRRPVYTSYELGKMVRDKRENSGMNLAVFAEQYGISEELLAQIETVSCSFSPKIYKTCGSILGLSSEELLAEYIDDVKAASYRTKDNGSGVYATFERANDIFNEIIMQRKIGIK
ncbi:MAG: hypothetical protein HFG82_11070 [Dorea sp.]|jgi:transcriptional regulator with XRE-family HTH domain|nr:hypothetical protein [Dorea sp.]